MSALTIRMPADKYERLKALSKRRGMSINRLIEEMATLALADFDTETRYLARVARGAGRQKRGLALLAKAAAPARRRA